MIVDNELLLIYTFSTPGGTLICCVSGHLRNVSPIFSHFNISCLHHLLRLEAAKCSTVFISLLCLSVLGNKVDES